jgi:3-deoxy-D-manno-octulosonic-acid transferase
MLSTQAIQITRTLLEQPASARNKELWAAFPGYLWYLLFHLLAWPYLAYRGWRIAQKRNERELTWTRLWGGTPPASSADRRGILILAKNLGEARAALLSAEQIRDADSQVPMAILVVMKLSYDFIRKPNASFSIGYTPYNNPLSAYLMLQHWKPQTILFANHNHDHHHTTYIAKCLGIKTLVVNGSLTDADAAGRHEQLRKRRFTTWRRTEIGAYAVQTEADKKRFVDLGVDERRILVTGPLYSTTERTADETNSLTGFWNAFLNPVSDEHTPVIIAGSTYPPEEEIILDAFATVQKSFPHAILVLAPRDSHRDGGADSTLRSRNLSYVRRSQSEQRPKNIPIVLLDTFGELKDIYAAANIAHVGGTFDTIVGGHTPVEALSWDIPMTIGPEYAHQVALVDKLMSAGLLTICQNAEELASAWVHTTTATASEQEQLHQCAEEIRKDRVIGELYRALLQ